MDIYEEIVKLRQEGRRGAVATIVNARGSIPSFKTAKMLVRDDGSIVGTIGGGCVEAEIWQAAREVMESEKPRTLTFNLNQNPKYDTGLVCGGTLDIFIEPVLPPALLYVFGAGHVAVNLYRTAKNAGFDVTVVDDRETYASRERFPEAKEVIAEDFDKAMARIAPPENSFIVIVSASETVTAPLIQSISVSNTVATIKWTTVAGRNYQLQYSADLGGTNWNAVVPDVPASETTAVANDDFGNATQRFYRVLVLP